jgi:DNA-binding MarR family transcriptional regulator
VSREDEVQAAAAAVRVTVSLLQRRIRESQPMALSLPETSVLSRLDRNGPDTTAGLARWEQITPQAVGVTVAALEAKSLVARATDPQDRRRAILTLTAAGLETLRAGRDTLTNRLAQVLGAEFTDDEVGLIRAAAPVLERLAQLI